MAHDSLSLPVLSAQNGIDQFEVIEWKMQDKYKWWLIKYGRWEGDLRRVG